jgi:hypothetical protein
MLTTIRLRVKCCEIEYLFTRWCCFGNYAGYLHNTNIHLQPLWFIMEGTLGIVSKALQHVIAS